MISSGIYYNKLQTHTIYGDFYISEGNNFGNNMKNIKVNKLNKIRLCPNICWTDFSPNSLKRRILFKTFGLNLRYFSKLILRNFDKDLKKINERSLIQFRDQKYVFCNFNSSGYSEGEGYQRKKIINILRLKNNKVNYKKYRNLLKNANVILSPFGWGEICFRDREAFINGGVLLKPDMSHIETFPDFYKKNITYIPCKWDLSDLKEAIDESINKSFSKNWLKTRDNLIIEELMQVKKKCIELCNEIFSLC